MSELLERLEHRLQDSDAMQVATLVLAALVVTLAAVWPTPGSGSNESWYAFAQMRSVVLALLALGFGASAAAEPPRRAFATALMVMVVAVLALPLEVAAYAASYPATPLWWSLVSVPVAAAGYLVLGALLGRLARFVRMGAFLPLLVPAAVAGLLVLDVQLGWTILNPLTAALVVSPWYLLTMTVLGLAGLLWLAFAWRRGHGKEARA